MDTNLISNLIDEKVFGVWFLIGAALVFWMQAGFAMVECGFARAKNAGNIIMKNLMDFCIGTVVFIVIGFGLFLGEDMLFGFMGMPNLDIFTNYASFDWSNFWSSRFRSRNTTTRSTLSERRLKKSMRYGASAG